ncbi:hypothetical protein MMC30_002781 [Trapelia coarctata]|nr:hypothetical protein [Trapelia coarctata]
MNPSAGPTGGGPPPSFKTNVNRAKTKRWVEAKSYSYDGDDWGEADEYDEYGGYAAPGSVQKPPALHTGLRQQGQRASPTGSVPQGRQEVHQSPSSYGEQTYIAPGGKLSQLHEEQNAMGRQPYRQSGDGRISSFNQGPDQRTYSMGSSHHGMPGAGPPGHAPFQQNYGQQQGPPQMRAPGPGQPTYHQPNQDRSRQSLDGPSRPMGAGPPAANNYRGVSYSERQRLSRDGSRSQSMTSSTSSMDFHSRRDFSPSAMPQPLHTQPRDHPARKSSLSQDEAPRISGGPYPSSANSYPPESSEGPVVSSPVESNDHADTATKPLPFVRPADIYKRMAEEREKERQSQESSRPSMDAILGPKASLARDDSPSSSGLRSGSDNMRGAPVRKPSFESGDDSEGGRRPKTSLDPVPERRSEYGMEGLTADLAAPKSESAAPKFTQPQETRAPTAAVSSSSDKPRLPPVPRMSGFGESFLGSMGGTYISTPDSQADTPKATDDSQDPAHLSPQDTPLQHQPSLGFRSVVNRAFEDQIPPTPSSTAGSAVARSNSESTNGISPIISRAPSAVTSDARARETETRERSISIIPEEPKTSVPKGPDSGDTIMTMKATTRKPSPSQISQPELSGSIPPPPFISGHRRNISTPSPDNSPARTPAVETNLQPPQPQEAELAVTTPTSMTHSSSSASNTLPAISSERGNQSSDAAVMPVTFGGESPQVPHTATPTVSDSLADSMNEPPLATHATSSTPHATTSSVPRAESPSKGRVRDLADKFDSENVSRRGSESSLKGSVHSVNTGKADESISSRPPTDRMESFRPHLPGGWESFASNAPAPSAQHSATASRGPVLGTQGPETNIKDSKSPLNLTTSALGPSSSDDGELGSKTSKEVSSENPERTATTNQSLPPSASESYLLSDPFSAVAAAGTALAGAITAAVGLDQEESESPQESVHETPKIDNTTASRGRAVSIQNTAIHPETKQPWTPAEDDTSSSVVPTPLAMYPADRANETDSPNYFPPVVPLKQNQREIQTSTEALAYTRPQVLPTLSTEASPNDYESDRLRKQLVRELSPHTERFPEDHMDNRNPPQADDDPRLSDQLNRHESIYDSYWNEPTISDETDHSLNHQDAITSEAPKVRENSVAPDPPSVEVQRSVTPASSEPVQEANRSDSLQVRPAQLTHRFSWEPVPEEINAPNLNTSAVDTTHLEESTPGQHLDFRSGFMQPSDGYQPSDNNTQVAKHLSAEPIHRDASSSQSTPPTQQQSLEDSVHLPSSISPEHATQDMPLPPLPSEQPKLPAFREILALKTSVERIQAYKATREQFANMNTGLDHWILTTLNDLPEHGELTKNGATFGNISGHKPSPSRGKFPGLRVVSGQTQQQPYYQQYLNASTQAVSPNPHTPGSANATSSPTSAPVSQGGRNSGHQMQAKGKDLLHTAGLFGGKANVAAKGLFSKGKSKFRGSGGADKATPRTPSAANPDSTPGVQQQNPSSSKLQIQDPPMPGSLDRVENNTPSTDSLSRSIHQNSTDQAVLSSSNHDTLDSSQHGMLPTNGAAVRSGQSPQHSTEVVNAIRAGSDSSGPPENPSSGVDDHRVVSSHADPPTAGHGPAVSPQSISPEVFQSPKSLSSSNRTPTQADFGPNTLNRDLPSPPSPLLPFDTPTPSGANNRANARVDTFSQSVPIYGHEDTREGIPLANKSSSVTVENASSLSQGKVNSNALQGVQQPKDSQSALVATPRTSEESGATFHTADSGEEFQMRQQTGRAVAIPPRSLPHPIRAIAVHTSMRRARNGNQSISTSQQASGANSATHSGESNNVSRPFSFISFGQVPVGDLTLRGPSLDNGRGRLYKDLPLTPASSEQSVNSRSQAAPVHHDSNHDFTSEGGQISGKPRPRSFSRPFQDPNLHEHPAFRQENAEIDDSNLPSTSYPPKVRREEAMIPQGTEYQLDGIGPPNAEEINKSRARRSSRGAAFFKRLSVPPAQDTPPLPHDVEARAPESPSDSPISQKKKGRRVSLFRSLTSRSRSDSGRSPSIPAAQPARAQTDLQQYMDTLPSSQRQHPSPKNQPTSQSPPVRQTSSVPEQEKGKKKRFSSLGTFLGRMSPKQQSKFPPAPQSRVPSQQQPQQPQTPFDEWLTPDERQRSGPSNPSTQGSAYHTNLQEYYQPAPLLEYDRSHLGGYYSPDKKDGFYPLGNVKEQQPSAVYQQPQTQPYSAVGQTFASNRPPSNAQPYSAQNNSRGASWSYGNYGNPNVLPSSSMSPQYQPYGRSQPALQGHSRGPSNRSVSANPDAAYVDTFMRNPQGYQETPLGRSSSPAPPPPPPKDDHLQKSPRSQPNSHTRSASLTAQAKQESRSPSPRGPTHTRQSLPPLQTSIAQIKGSSSKPITPDEVRKARQRKIEESGPAAPTPPQTGGQEGSRLSNDAEEKIVMSSTSYPGQEWQPSFGNWDGD